LGKTKTRRAEMRERLKEVVRRAPIVAGGVSGLILGGIILPIWMDRSLYAWMAITGVSVVVYVVVEWGIEWD
jgi:hypothetical protein